MKPRLIMSYLLDKGWLVEYTTHGGRSSYKTFTGLAADTRRPLMGKPQLLSGLFACLTRVYALSIMVVTEFSAVFN